MADFTREQLDTISEIFKLQYGDPSASQEATPVEPQNFGALPQQQQTGAAMPPEEMMRQQPGVDMSTQKGKEEYLRQQVEAIRGRMTPGGPTGSSKVRDEMMRQQTGAAMTQDEMMRQQTPAAMTPEEMQMIQQQTGGRR
tara:strand:- start:2802 stop:3221 length:420 start_codon:yes stop_codon:yes gene_type:complete